MRNTRRKIDLYILSLGLLFIFIAIITIKVPDRPFTINNFAEWKILLLANYMPILSTILLAYSFYAYKKFDFDLQGATDIPFEIMKVESINYEHLTFLATYVIPLIGFDFDKVQQVIVLALLLVVLCAIYIKTDLFYANPSLALLGFHIYRADGHFKDGDREGVILVCRGRLIKGQRVSYIKLDDRIYYAKGVAK